MKIQCNACEAAEAKVLCCADEAALCLECDEKVHAANKLAGKHQRVLLITASSTSSARVPRCDICQESLLPGFFILRRCVQVGHNGAERYGNELTAEELIAFDSRRSDYKVGWHIDRLRRRLVPTLVDSRGRSAIVRNRRRSYMEQLIRGGEYFFEDSMREREPYLHHQYVGMFQDPARRGLSINPSSTTQISSGYGSLFLK